METYWITSTQISHRQFLVAALSKAWVCGHSRAGIAGSNHTGGVYVCCEYCLL